MIVHVVDGTYELFRHYYAVPSRQNSAGDEIAATTGVLRHLLNIVADGATHIGVAVDTVVESFRNQLYPYYKNGEGMDPDIRSQFPILEDGIEALGMKLCRMVDYEADDGMASMAAIAAADPAVERVMLNTPDKDLAQSVVRGRVLQVDRRNNKVLDHDDVIEKHGVPPESIPDYLALTGDAADGFPGLRGWGKKSAATVLSEYGTIENIPLSPGQWEVTVRSSAKLAETLAENMEDALLFKKLATLVADAPTIKSVDELEWHGPADNFESFCDFLGSKSLFERAQDLIPKKG